MRPSARLAPRERTRRRASLRAPAASIDLSTATNARPRETVFYEPRVPRRRGAALHHRQLAGRLLASRAAVGNVIRKVTQVCHRVVFAACGRDNVAQTENALGNPCTLDRRYSVIPVLSRRARIGDSGTRLTSAAHSHALQLGAPRLPLVPRRRPLAACSSALPTAAAAQRRAAAAASIVARERTRQRTVPVSRRDLGASWCRTRPITRYAAAVMRSFQTVFCFVRHVWYGANTFPLRILYGLR